MADGLVDALAPCRKQARGEIGERLALGAHGLGRAVVGRAGRGQARQGQAVGGQLVHELAGIRLAELLVRAAGQPPGQPVHGVEVVESLAQARRVVVEQVVLLEAPHFQNVVEQVLDALADQVAFAQGGQARHVQRGKGEHREKACGENEEHFGTDGA